MHDDAQWHECQVGRCCPFCRANTLCWAGNAELVGWCILVSWCVSHGVIHPSIRWHDASCEARLREHQAFTAYCVVGLFMRSYACTVTASVCHICAGTPPQSMR